MEKKKIKYIKPAVILLLIPLMVFLINYAAAAVWEERFELEDTAWIHLTYIADCICYICQFAYFPCLVTAVLSIVFAWKANKEGASKVLPKILLIFGIIELLILVIVCLYYAFYISMYLTVPPWS